MIFLQSNSTRPEEILRREGFTYVIPRANDYTRMFSAPARRSAPAHPESPRHDKKPRPSPLATPTSPKDEVQLRERSAAVDPTERLSASDFYTVTEDSTPQPFKGELNYYRSNSQLRILSQNALPHVGRPTCKLSRVVVVMYRTLRV